MYFIVGRFGTEGKQEITIDLETKKKYQGQIEENTAEGETCLGVFPFLNPEEDHEILLKHLVARHEMEESLQLEWEQLTSSLVKLAFKRGYLAGKGLIESVRP